MTPPTLDYLAEERPLTHKECVKLLAGLIGALIDMAEDVETVKGAVAWFSSNDPMAIKTWELFQNVKVQMQRVREMAAAQAARASDLKKPD
jgi:hypothetical protein